MSAVLEVQEPSAKYLARAEPALVHGFEMLSTSSGGVAKLRALIISLAVQGKLVHQDSAEGTAGLLLAQIRTELSGKTKRSDIATLATEEPFAIPSTWEWVAMGDVIDIVRGITFPANEKTREPGLNRIACLRTTNVQKCIEWEDLLFVDRKFMGREDQLIRHHDIVMSMANSRELVGKVALIENVPHAEATFGGFLGVLRPCNIEPQYAMALLRSDYARSALIDSSSQTTNIANISLGKLRPLPFPLPPLAEQHRIVARVEELMKLCDALEQSGRLADEQHARLTSTLFDAMAASESAHGLAENWQRIAEHFDLLLDRPEAIDALEQTILELAVRGLLVPQDARDQPMNELLAVIREEKNRLIARGLVKRDKPSVPVNIDGQPFAVPPSWNWVRIADVCSHVTDGEHATPQRCEDATAIPLVTAKNVRNEFMDYTVTDFVPSDVAAKCWLRCKPEPGDILMVSVGATLGRLCVLREPVDMVIVRSVTLLRPVHVGVFADYLALHLMSSGSQREIWSEVKQSAQPGLYLAKSAALKIALPPLAEQQRIVARIEELRRLCTQLRGRLTEARQTQALLADALVAQATTA